jgi:hypothetical protein
MHYIFGIIVIGQGRAEAQRSKTYFGHFADFIMV